MSAGCRATGSKPASTVAGLAFVAMLAVACTTPPPPPEKFRLSDAELLSGTALFGETVRETPRGDVLALDDEMRAFVARKVGKAKRQATRLRRLVRGMISDGLLNIEYDTGATRTARETFHQRSGNCLSFTNLFVALAREAGIEARFQILDIPPVWVGDGDTVMLRNHINAVVNNMREGRYRRRDYVVDFNTPEFSGNYKARQVSDAYAVALYHSNLAVKALEEENTREAFRHLRRAIHSYPDIPGPWVNLGVLYARSGLPRLAESAQLRALEAQPGNHSAMTNLARLHTLQGNTEQAAYYQRRVRFYQQQNPWYHFWLANQAMGAARFADAFEALERALNLQPDEHRFHFLAGRIHTRLGNLEAARQSFAQALEHARNEKLRSRYESKLAALGKPHLKRNSKVRLQR